MEKQASMDEVKVKENKMSPFHHKKKIKSY